MSSTDLAILAAIKAGNILDGVSTDYLSESRDESTIAAIVFVTCLTSIVVAARCFSRTFLAHRFGTDDSLILLSMVRAFTYCIPEMLRPHSMSYGV